ncbi:hypothetical protein BD410DRAFT_564581 [Rickenella mellea]|uniref:CCHC-type domain-containing protein n=1 Tax=Rickenella mellea TaxID=50990 RepID=A0A4Y7QGT3_9AGAM|nr:hypothetical protein BD410DRAFT_564581 [Rickenella mellea]
MTAVLKTVVKEGPNQGKKFWVCPNSEKARCGFFEWDEGGNSEGSSAPSRTATGSQGASQTTGECFKCNQTGHWAASCPNEGDRGRTRTKSFGSNVPGNAPSGACFKCNQEGHYSNACPNDGTGSRSFSRGGSKRGRGRTVSRGRGGSKRGRRKAAFSAADDY